MSTPEPPVPAGPACVPQTHRDLLERPLDAALTTLLPNGYPQTHPVWFSRQEPDVLVNTMRGFRKEQNMRADPRVSVLVVDPDADVHWIEVRGVVALTEQGAAEHLDELAYRYVGVRQYFGDAVPADLAETEVPVLGRIRPLQVTTDADPATAPVGSVAGPLGATIPADGATPGDAPGDDAPPVAVPVTHRDLLDLRLTAALATIGPDGHPRARPARCVLHGGEIAVNVEDPDLLDDLCGTVRATVLVVDPRDGGRWVEVRGDGRVSGAGRERDVVLRLRPRRVVCDAIHR